jgi:OOP family OmpA-OmpF porin
MGNVGAGLQYLITQSIGLQADLRAVWSETNVNRDDQTNMNTILNLGAIYRFDEPAAPVAVVAPQPVVAKPLVIEQAPVVVPPPVVVETPKAVCKPIVETITIHSDTLFDFDKSTIKGKNNEALDNIANKIKAHNDIEFILVTGHTDKIGSDAYNQKLSERRADAVRNYLASHGVQNARIKSAGKGETQPVIDCKGSKNVIECLAPNRRVVIDATHKQESGCAAN